MSASEEAPWQRPVGEARPCYRRRDLSVHRLCNMGILWEGVDTGETFSAMNLPVAHTCGGMRYDSHMCMANPVDTLMCIA